MEFYLKMINSIEHSENYDKSIKTLLMIVINVEVLSVASSIAFITFSGDLLLQNDERFFFCFDAS